MDIDGLYKSDDGCALRFFVEPQQNNHASAQYGRPIFDECLMVEVIAPGSRESSPVFELERKFAEEVGIAAPRRHPVKYREYEKQIKSFREGSDSADLRGTPLTAWPAISTALAASCKHAGVYTVEALAALPDSRLNVLGPGARSLVTRAQQFLEAANGNADTERLAAENAELRTDLERVRTEMRELSARLMSPPAADLPPPSQGLPDLTGSNPPPPPVADPPVSGQPKTKRGGGGNTTPPAPII